VRRWTLRLTLVALVTLALATSGQPSAVAACPPLDVGCQVDEVIDTGEGLVDDVIDPIETPVDDTIDPIVDPIVDDVFDTVDDVLGGGGPIDLPDPIGGGDGGGSHVGGPATPHEHPSAHRPNVPEERGAVVAGRSPDGPGIATGPTISAASGIAALDSADRTSGNRFGEVLGGVARSLAVVLALFGLAVAFVTIQDRFDRSDPRLALAPVESDVVEFA
jgi:hypothetical protein